MTINVFGGGNTGGPAFPLQRSVRLRSSASAYFNRTQSSGNNQKFTLSQWVKRGKLGATQYLFTAFNASTDGINFSASNQLEVFFANGSTYDLITTAVYRDPSAWYHIVVSVDTTQATAANRVQLFVNNVAVSFGTGTQPPQNYTFPNINANTVAARIGTQSTGIDYFDGYLTEVNFIDGQALTPASFGSINSTTGVWQPIKYSGTYGTNGFYLNFQDNSGVTATTIGKDSSGNGNNWTPNNISVTAGVTYDSMLDVPTNTGATNANFAVMNPLTANKANAVDGNIRIAGGDKYSNSTIGMTSGKWYAEMTVITVGTESSCGISNDTPGALSYVGSNSSSWGYYSNDGFKYTGASGASYGSTYTTNDVIGIAFDADNGTLTFYKNNTSQGVAYTGLTNGPYYFSVSGRTTGTANNCAINFGQRPFTYTPPTGFKSLNTFNLPAPTIPNGATQFAATTYTGTGSSLAIANTVNGKSFQPDFVWVKGRSGATDHALYDSVRGTTLDLVSNSTAAETTQATGLTAFGSGGFTVGALAKMNTNTATYVGWQWKAGGTAVTNTSGSISSQVSANPSAGFSIVTYTGNGTASTVGHGLGITPKLILVKPRSGIGDWITYSSTTGAGNYLLLNTTAASTANVNVWNNTSPTSSVFNIGVSTGTNQNTTTYVAYCFSEIAGYSKFGSYTGNGSTDGTFVYTGFRPRFVLVKSSSAVEGWVIWDSARDTYNAMPDVLYPNLSNAEGANTQIDFLSNGFKLRNSATNGNITGVTYIYAAFAESPFNYSLAR